MPQDLRKGGRGASARAAGAPLTLLEGRQSWSWMVRVQTSRRARCLDWDRHMGRSRLRLHTGLSGASAASGDWARRGLNRTQIEHKSRSSLVPANQKDAGLQVISLVGETGFEPATARPPAGCATRLRHSPWHLCFCGERSLRRKQPPAASHPAVMGTSVCVCRLWLDKNLRALRAAQAGVGLRLVPEGARTARQLLPGMPGGLQTRALRGAPRALRRECPSPQAGDHRGARRPPRGLLPRATVRRLWRG